jgi:hypothetical protein
MKVRIGISSGETFEHDVPAEAVAHCLGMDRSLCRFEFWRKVTGNDRILGHAMVWEVITHGQEVVEENPEERQEVAKENPKQVQLSLDPGDLAAIIDSSGSLPMSTTRYVQTKKIADTGIASLLARLMMIVNDMAIVNECLRVWSTSKDKRWESRKGGGRALFARVQMSYVYEALEVIKEIRDSQTLMVEVSKCTKKTQACFAAVKAFIDTDDYKKLIRLRNNAGFHYDPKLAERAVKEIAADFPNDSSTMTLGKDPLNWHFVLGDKVQDKVVVRYIFEVPKDKDIGKESDEIAGRVFDMAEKLAEFAGYFIWERTNYEPR